MTSIKMSARINYSRTPSKRKACKNDGFADFTFALYRICGHSEEYWAFLKKTTHGAFQIAEI